MDNEYDFSGWATRNDIRCSDGRVIRHNAFADCDGIVVPLVWNHSHDDPNNVLGHALLENRNEGVYTYGVFNDTEAGQNARDLVKHGDIKSLSIYANQLRQNGSDVIHGAIREVSLVLAGANPGAFIDTVLAHSEYNDGETAIIYSGEDISLEHAVKADPTDSYTEAEEEPKAEVSNKKKRKKKVEEDTVAHYDDEEYLEHADGAEQAQSGGETLADVFETLSDKQKKAVYAMIGYIINNQQGSTSESSNNEGENMKHNVFDSDYDSENYLSHADTEAIFADAKRYGSLKDSTLAHGISDIEYLFPDATKVENTPEWVKRPDEWVSIVMNGTHHSPFSRIKSLFADIREDEARAKGFLHDHTHRDAKGNLVDASGNPAFKKEEVFSLLKRTTTPTTIYKKQKLDRDDVIDITDFDVVAWIKGEMRTMLDEEIARAILVGDGRLASDDDKINETNIRPIWTDSDFYTIHKSMEFAADATDTSKAKEFIRTAIKARKDYRGTGTPTLFTTEDVLTDCLLIEDTNGRVIYDSQDKLATALRVSKIVTVPVMENLTRTVGSDTMNLMGIIVNLNDYNVGADKGGAVNMFDDFDIDYNTQKYLIETRCSGALIKPYSAIVLESKAAE